MLMCGPGMTYAQFRKLISNGPKDGRRYQRIIDKSHLPLHKGCVMRIRQLQADGSYRYHAGGILVFVSEDLVTASFLSIFKPKSSINVPLESATFWVLPRKPKSS